MSQVIISIPEQEFWQKLNEIVAANVAGLLQEQATAKTYTINAAAQQLRRGHSTVKRLIDAGILQTTKDGRITAAEIQKYIINNK